MIILGYPRSGSTWLKYCIEFLSKRPTGTPGTKNEGENPICEIIPDMGVDLSSAPIAYKTHNLSQFNPKYDEIILLVRDYKEAIPRHYRGMRRTDLMKRFNNDTRGKANAGIDYLKVIEQFDELERDKLLIYYEDLITAPQKSILKVIDFLKVDHKHVDKFFINYNFHKQQGIKAYHDKSVTQGNKTKFHQKHIHPGARTEMTKILKRNNNAIFNKYLKRYE